MTDVEEVKRRLNIVDVVGEYVKLQKAGVNYRARCPFHPEKTPSFFVSPEKQIWHCFGGCNKGGDIFRFLMEIENMEFGEALRLLAGRAGVELKKFDQGIQDSKSHLFQINEIAAVFFQKAFTKAEGGQMAKEYLDNRKINEESIMRFRLGYAPSSWRSLLTFLEGKGYKKEDAISAGLAVKNEEGKVYDRFRGRIMFPVRTPAGHIVGFSGRTLSKNPEEAKYINTPQTLIYDKSRDVYGLYEAKHAIIKEDEVIFVEGNADVVLSSQAGVEHIVATSGTALTPRHLEMIHRYTKNSTFCFDSDSAGEAASKRAFEMALKQGFEVCALSLGQEKDPAEVVTVKGSKAWQNLAAKKISLMEFLWAEETKGGLSQTMNDKKRIINNLFHFLAMMQSRIEKGYWLKEISQRFSFREEDVIHEFQKFENVDKNISNVYDDHIGVIPNKKNRLAQDKENLAGLLLLYPHFLEASEGFVDMAVLKKGISLSNEELLLKAEVYWPNEQLAKRELERILNHLAFIKKKEETINKIKR